MNTTPAGLDFKPIVFHFPKWSREGFSPRSLTDPDRLFLLSAVLDFVVVPFPFQEVCREHSRTPLTYTEPNKGAQFPKQRPSTSPLRSTKHFPSPPKKNKGQKRDTQQEKHSDHPLQPKKARKETHNTKRIATTPPPKQKRPERRHTTQTKSTTLQVCQESPWPSSIRGSGSPEFVQRVQLVRGKLAKIPPLPGRHVGFIAQSLRRMRPVLA